VSLPTGRDSLPAQKRSDKHSSSRGEKCRLLQPLLPRTQKRQELSANIRSTCVKKGCSSAGWPSSGGAPVSTGLCYTQRKKRSLRQASYAFSGYDLRLHLHGGQAVSRTNKCHHNMRAPVLTDRKSTRLHSSHT